jgi:hypothetical protein
MEEPMKKLIGRLAASLLEYLYVVPARVRRRREGR